MIDLRSVIGTLKLLRSLADAVTVEGGALVLSLSVRVVDTLALATTALVNQAFQDASKERAPEGS